MKARRVRSLVIWLGFTMLGLGGLGGMAIERMRFEPQRTAMLEHLEAVIGTNQAAVIGIEPCVRAEALARERLLGSAAIGRYRSALARRLSTTGSGSPPLPEF